MNSLLLVWGGYILSRVGTTTLTAALLIKYFNEKIEELIKSIGEDEEE